MSYGGVNPEDLSYMLDKAKAKEIEDRRNDRRFVKHGAVFADAGSMGEVGGWDIDS